MKVYIGLKENVVLRRLAGETLKFDNELTLETRRQQPFSLFTVEIWPSLTCLIPNFSKPIAN